MKALTCEMCGSTNLLKQDGVFVCQSCGTKYSVEEAKKMMVEGTVDVKGTVKVDTSGELKNLYEIARRAKETDNAENGLKYYDMILVKDPKSWEANFYVAYFRAANCRIMEISSVAYALSNAIKPTMDLIYETEQNENDRIDAIKEITLKGLSMAAMLESAATSTYEDTDRDYRHKVWEDFSNRMLACSQLSESIADELKAKDINKNKELIILAYKQVIKNVDSCINTLSRDFPSVNTNGLKDSRNSYYDKIKEVDPTFDAESAKKQSNASNSAANGGCYVATAVYGSYDCPEVWTLRRFRDNTLAETWYGRAFIHTYYAISPTLVKWFGHTEWFKKMWKEPLDSLVRKLQSEGVENTPYNDRIW